MILLIDDAEQEKSKFEFKYFSILRDKTVKIQDIKYFGGSHLSINSIRQVLLKGKPQQYYRLLKTGTTFESCSF